jgi:hypothetical protein
MLISGRIPGRARANNVFPDPGEPAISTLWTKNRPLFSTAFIQNLVFIKHTLEKPVEVTARLATESGLLLVEATKSIPKRLADSRSVRRAFGFWDRASNRELWICKLCQAQHSQDHFMFFHFDLKRI